MSNEKRRYDLKVRAERQQETRRRIVEATVELHMEVGPAKTTIAEVARRAGTSRLTVYQHFPQDAELFAACQKHFIELNPRPDFSRSMALPTASKRVRETLRLLYAWYSRAVPMTEKIQRDRHGIPALDALMKRTSDEQLERTAELLASGFRGRGKRAERLRSLVRLALDFWTWRRLRSEGLDDPQAADLMNEVITAAALPTRSGRGKSVLSGIL